jgi:hypothetical protein
MPRYKMVVQEVYDVWYEVEADTEEEAYDVYLDGDGEMLDKMYSHMVDDSLEVVENLDESEAALDEAVKKAEFGDWQLFWEKTQRGGKDEEDIL